MAGVDDAEIDNNYNDDDQDGSNSVLQSSTSCSNMASLTQFGLPSSVIDMLCRMAPHGDRLTWTVVENAHMVTLALNWNIQRRHSLAAAVSGYHCSDFQERLLSDYTAPLNGSGGGGGGGASSCVTAAMASTCGKDSLWTRIRRTLQHQNHQRASVSSRLASVVSAAISNSKRRQNGSKLQASASAGTLSSSSSSAVTSSGGGGGTVPEVSGSRSSGSGRARMAREMWRKSVERDKAVRQATVAVDGTSGGWSRDESLSPPGMNRVEWEHPWCNGADRVTSNDRELCSTVADDVCSAAATPSQCAAARRRARRLQSSTSLPERIIEVQPSDHQRNNRFVDGYHGSHACRRQLQSMAMNGGVALGRQPRSTVTRQRSATINDDEAQPSHLIGVSPPSRQSSWPRLHHHLRNVAAVDEKNALLPTTHCVSSPRAASKRDVTSMHLPFNDSGTASLSVVAGAPSLSAVSLSEKIAFNDENEVDGESIYGGRRGRVLVDRRSQSASRASASQQWVHHRGQQQPQQLGECGGLRQQPVTILVQTASTETIEMYRSLVGHGDENCARGRRVAPGAIAASNRTGGGAEVMMMMIPQQRALSSTMLHDDVHHQHHHQQHHLHHPDLQQQQQQQQEQPPVDFRTVMLCLDSCDKVLSRHSTTIT